MSSTYSNSLRIELIGSGDQSGTWGTTTDTNLAYVLDTSIAGYITVPVTSTSQLLTYVNGGTSTSGLNQSVYSMIQFTGASADSYIFAPPVSKTYIVYNNTSYSILLYNSVSIGVIPSLPPSTVGVTIPAGKKVMVFSDGTNFYTIDANSLTSTLPVANGGTGATSFTSGALLKGAGTSAVSPASSSDILGQIGTVPVANGGTGVTTAAAITSLVGNLLFPIGAIYSSTSSTNPGTALGFGTWAAFGAGRTLIGNGGGFTAGTTGGSADAIIPNHDHNATFTGTALPTHQHSLNARFVGAGGTTGGDLNKDYGTGAYTDAVSAGTPSGTVTVANANGGQSVTNANLPPYIVVYMWQRTA